MKKTLIITSSKVEKETTKEMAKQIAKSLEGVASLDNRVKVAKDTEDSGTPVGDAVANAESEVKDALLEARVKTKLLGELGRHGFGINVEATDGVVSLRGDVSDENRREIGRPTRPPTDASSTGASTSC